MLTEGMRLLGQRQRALLLFPVPYNGQWISSPCPPNSMQLKQSSAQVDVTSCGLLSQPSLGNPYLLKMAISKPIRTFPRVTFYLLNCSANKPVCNPETGSSFYLLGFLLEKHPWNLVQDKSWLTHMQKCHGELFLNTDDVS